MKKPPGVQSRGENGRGNWHRQKEINDHILKMIYFFRLRKYVLKIKQWHIWEFFVPSKIIYQSGFLGSELGIANEITYASVLDTGLSLVLLLTFLGPYRLVSEVDTGLGGKEREVEDVCFYFQDNNIPSYKLR